MQCTFLLVDDLSAAISSASACWVWRSSSLNSSASLSCSSCSPSSRSPVLARLAGEATGAGGGRERLRSWVDPSGANKYIFCNQTHFLQIFVSQVFATSSAQKNMARKYLASQVPH